MSRLTQVRLWLEREIRELEKPVASHRHLVVEEVIIVLAVLVWVGAMLLLP